MCRFVGFGRSSSFSSLGARGSFACHLLLVLIALPQRFGLKVLHPLLAIIIIFQLLLVILIRCRLLQLTWREVFGQYLDGLWTRRRQ